MRDPSPYAGQTVRLRSDAAELGGHQAEVVDWYDRLGTGQSWRVSADGATADPRAVGYAVRRGLGGLPDDDEVLFARVDGMGQLIHLSEIEGTGAPVLLPSGPTRVNPAAVGLRCPACQVELADGDLVAALPLGPGANPAARAACRSGGPYEAVVIELHWACRTGDESYSATEV